MVPQWVTTMTLTAPVKFSGAVYIVGLHSRYTKFEIAHPDLKLDPTSFARTVFHIPPSTPSMPMRSLPRLRSSPCFTFSISMSRMASKKITFFVAV